MPETMETYTHRTGRTGRANRTGIACTFATAENAKMAKMLEHKLGAKLTCLDHPHTALKTDVDHVETKRQNSGSRKPKPRVTAKVKGKRSSQRNRAVAFDFGI